MLIYASSVFTSKLTTGWSQPTLLRLVFHLKWTRVFVSLHRIIDRYICPLYPKGYIGIISSIRCGGGICYIRSMVVRMSSQIDILPEWISTLSRAPGWDCYGA